MEDKEKKEPTVTLDNQPATQQQVSEARANPNVRVVETTPGSGSFKTLKRLQG